MKKQAYIFTHWRLFTVLPALLLAGNLALAQEAPVPHKSPRVPVNRQMLPDSRTASLARSRNVQGTAAILDGEHLRVSDVDLRLFGVVPPQLSASFGPQARAALDQLTTGQSVDCRIRDRDHDGRFLATCSTVNTKADLALELLKRGLAVTARGSLQPTELAVPYEAAEDAAQRQKLGLWSVLPPPAATIPVAPPVIAAKTDNANLPPLPSELKKDANPAVTEKPPVVISAPAPSASPAPFAAASAVPAPRDDESANGPGEPGFFARYQLLITGLVMLATALGIMIVLAVERRKDRRDEMKAIAAALRGELLAARAVCLARLKTWSEADEKSAAWPRIRATLYQAYVGRLGWLGGVLARQIASIYGQASDYAAYFNPNSAGGETRMEATSKRQALGLLVQHIEEVLPKLAVIEQTGRRPKGGTPPSVPVFTPAPETDGREPASYVAAAAKAAPVAPLWNFAKLFARARPAAPRNTAEEAMTDYAAMIEEEMARMSYEEETRPDPSNVTKIGTR